MKLREKRIEFSRKFALLVLYMTELGYGAAIDDVKASSGHMKNSLHYLGLAGDLLLYKDGKYLKDSKDYKLAGLFWESLGGSWGGRFRRKDGKPKPDGDHFSIAYQGRK